MSSHVRSVSHLHLGRWYMETSKGGILRRANRRTHSANCLALPRTVSLPFPRHRGHIRVIDFRFQGSHDFHPAHGITHHILVKEGSVGPAEVQASHDNERFQPGNRRQKHAFRSEGVRRTAWNPKDSDELCRRDYRTWPALSIASRSGLSRLK